MENIVRVRIDSKRSDAGLIIDRNQVEVPDSEIIEIPDFIKTPELISLANGDNREDFIIGVYKETEEEPYIDEYIDFFLDWFDEGPDMRDYYRGVIQDYCHENIH